MIKYCTCFVATIWLRPLARAANVLAAFVHRFSKVLRKLKSVYHATHRPVKGSR